jgi:hypothetical protein
MQARTSGGAFNGTLLLVLGFLTAMLTGSEAFAQARGEVSARPKGPAGLEALARRMAESPETRLDLYLTPQFIYEKFDDYAVVGEFYQDPDPDRPPPQVISPDFTISTTEIGVGADYLFPNALLLGGSFSYSHANYDFESGSVMQFDAEEPIATGPSALGEPLDRSYDEYGFTLAAGYLKDPWAVLLTGRYARRDNIETLRREAPLILGGNRFIVQAQGDTHSNVYSSELSVNYRVGFENGASLTGLASLLYQLEEIDSYTEHVDSVFSAEGGRIEEISKREFLDSEGSAQVREFNSQAIASLPLEIGALFSTPVGDLGREGVFSLTNLNIGMTYTHDFDNQRRTVRSESLENKALSVKYKEKNRNQDFVSFNGALDFDLFNLVGTVSYQGDVGFDEREYAHVFSLQLRVPLSF